MCPVPQAISPPVQPRPGELSARERELRQAFLTEVERIPGGDRLRRCIQCGTCSGSCPVSYAMDVQPRQLVGYFRAGDLNSIMNSRTIWICASCYACTVRCPSGIKVTDLIYALKRMAMDGRVRTAGLPVATLSAAFVNIVKRLGRNHELELMLRYGLRQNPFGLLSMAPLGWRMWRAGRMQWRSHRIKGLDGLRRIIARAEAMEEAHPRETLEPTGHVGYGVVDERPRSASVGASS